jgi:hypothetical protein
LDLKIFYIDEFRAVLIGVRELGRKLVMCVKGMKVRDFHCRI